MIDLALPAFLDTGRAHCAQPGADPEMWHSTDPGNQHAAADACSVCPLRTACLDYALTTRQRSGVWGGLTVKQRGRLLSDDGSWLDDEGRLRRPCETEGGFLGHRRYGETCQRCDAAHEARVLARRQLLLAEAHMAGGTTSGAEIHRRLGELPCALCRGAVARQSAARRAATQPPAQGAAAAA